MLVSVDRIYCQEMHHIQRPAQILSVIVVMGQQTQSASEAVYHQVYILYIFSKNGVLFNFYLLSIPYSI